MDNRKIAEESAREHGGTIYNTVHRISPLKGRYEAEVGVRVFILFFIFFKEHY